MSIRKLFDKSKPKSVVSSTDIKELAKPVESDANITQKIIEKNRFIPQRNYAQPESFAKFGSAEKYYSDSFDRIVNQYPYDGALSEITEFFNNSTYLDLYIYDNVYPRTTGYVTISPNGWGNVDSKSGDTGLPEDIEYIQAVGGPHTASGGMAGKELLETFENSNIYDPDKNRESNLKFDFTRGVTLETWIKKEALIGAADSDFETIFHLTNDETGLNTSGSLLWALDTSEISPTDNPVRVIYTSGTISERFEYPEITTGDLIDGNWHHLAVSFQISGTSPTEVVLSKGYLDGELKSTLTIAEPIGEVTGALIANVGAMRPMSNDLHAGGSHPGTPGTPIPQGSAKLSASLDEFRYWKTARTSEEIGRYWFVQYGGGTNKVDANTDLGVYYKFNEGITGVTETDKIVLDYSGRISNGTWVGYTPQGRSTQSAIDLYLGKQSEFKDPIIYSFHPDVISARQSLIGSGSTHDLLNNASLYYTMPSWIIEEDDESGQELLNLTQILSSYLDTLYLQIENYPRLKDVTYPSSQTKPIPFAHKLLDGYGLSTSEIFVDATILEQISNRNEDMKFDADLSDIKNLIYKNIYNNLTYIYKSKGNMKSFRNLMRCYGIDTDLIKINLYGDNAMYRFRDNYEARSTRKKYIDFNNTGRFEGSIYQQTASTDPSSVSFITGSGTLDFSKEGFTALTLESEVIFPRKLTQDQPEYFATNFLSASLFGYHSADPNAPTDFTWPTFDANIGVYSVREERESKNVKFVIESTYASMPFALETDLFYDVYDNEKWNFAVRVSPDVYGGDLVSGTLGGIVRPTYTVEFYGVNSDAGAVKNEFLISTSSVNLFGNGHLVIPKRIYAGAHRTNFTGSIIEKTDVKLGSVRYWASYLNNEVIKAHARDPENFGTLSPHKSAYLYPIDLAGVKIPEMETLALNWAFDTLTGSNAAGTFAIPDLSSGSTELSQRYKTFGPIVNLQHTGEADFFPASSSKVLDTKFVYSGKQTLPENIQSSDMVNIEENDNVFKLTTRPVEYFFAIEKSMYQNISEEILNIFATIVDFNTLIGDPVNRYRQEYKQLAKLRQLFFERVQNEPDLDRYIDFYKWIDNSLSNFLNQLIPASAKFSDGMRTMVESHVLERNKYWTKFPTLDFETPDLEGGLNAVNELLYNWKDGHKPLTNSQSDGCFWWNQRAERNGPETTSGDSAVDFNRNQYLSASLQVLNRSFSTPYRFSVKQQDINIGGSNFYRNKIVNYAKNTIPWVDRDGGSRGIYITSENIEPYTCNDDIDPLEKRKLKFSSYTTEAGMSNSKDPNDYKSGKGDRFVPFSIYSSSFVNSYSDNLVSALGHNIEITNNHDDTYGALMGTAMQGPFPEKFVGGRQVRHIDLNQGDDNQRNRAEEWQIKTAAGVVKIARQPSQRPRAMLYRDQIAKRPVNIRNIKQVNGAPTGFVSGTLHSNIGNYRSDYEVVQAAGGRTTNNRAWVRNGPWNLNDELDGTHITASYYVPDMFDDAEIKRGRTPHVFVSRFSAPGGPDTMGDSNGGPGLDRYAAEFSPNNDLNWRNMAVRGPFKDLMLTPHVNQFGYYGGLPDLGIEGSAVNAQNYNGTGSHYQINRNTRLRLEVSGGTVITSSAHDNYYVQHPIPATDLRYSWITSSVETITPAAFGYWPKDYYVPSSTNAFVSPVNFATISDTNLEVDFVGMNIFIYEPIPEHYTFAKLGQPYNIYGTGASTVTVTVKVNYKNKIEAQDFNYSDIKKYRNRTFGTLSPEKALNGLNLHRNGPYQSPSWKQVRGAQHPVARYTRRNNFIGCTGQRLLALKDSQVNYGSRPPGLRLVSETLSSFYYEPAVQKVSIPFEVQVVIDQTDSQGSACSPKSPTGGPNATPVPPAIVGLGVSLINDYRFVSDELSNCSNILQSTIPQRTDKIDDPFSTPTYQYDAAGGQSCLATDTAYKKVTDMYLGGALSSPASPAKEFIEAIFRAPVFPAPANKFSSQNRKRSNYRNRVFVSGRQTRTIEGNLKFNGEN
jgi:hypothetical protein